MKPGGLFTSLVVGLAGDRRVHWLFWAALLAGALVVTVLAANQVYIPGDVRIARTVQEAHQAGWTDPLSEAWYQLGAFPVYPLVGLTVAIVFMTALGRPLAGAFVVLAMLTRPFGVLIKDLVERPRPDASLVTYVEGASGFSFPSGHVFGTVLLVGFICYALIEHERDIRKRLAVALGGVFVALLMGVQRVYAGAHWPSDVLAAYLWGAVVLFALIQTYRSAGRLGFPRRMLD